MTSKNEIEKGFELLGLLDDKEREKFHLLNSFVEKKEKEKTYVFIKTSSTTKGIDKEEDHAKLERNS